MGLQEILTMIGSVSTIDNDGLKNIAGFAGGGIASLVIFGTAYVVDNHIRPKLVPYIRQGLAKIPRRKTEAEDAKVDEELIYSFLKPKDSLEQ